MNTNRIPCPHCSELILPEAKKCRFCGERLEIKKKSFSLKVLYWVWFLSILVFLIALFFVRRADVPDTTWLIILGLLALNVLGGAIAFLMLLVRVLDSFKAKNAKWYGLASLVTIFAFFWLFINYETVEAKLGFSPPQKKQAASQVTVIPSPSPSLTPTDKPIQRTQTASKTTTTNQIDCTGPDGVVFKTTQQECDNFNKAWGNVPSPDPNEMIRCNIHPNCGGGYKEMTRSSCDQMTCCTTDTGSAVFTSKSLCSKQADESCMKQANQMYSQEMANCAKNLSLYSSTGYDCTGEANKLYEKLKATCGK